MFNMYYITWIIIIRRHIMCWNLNSINSISKNSYKGYNGCEISIFATYLLWHKLTDCFLRFYFGPKVVDSLDSFRNILEHDQPDLILLTGLKVVCKSWGEIVFGPRLCCFQSFNDLANFRSTFLCDISSTLTSQSIFLNFYSIQ